MNRISLNCSSFVGQQANYQQDWSRSVDAVNAYYQPLATFAQRFEQMLIQVRALGYSALDLWTAGQLNWAWAEPEHLTVAGQLLKKHSLAVTSLGGAFGDTRAEFERACRMAINVDTSLLSGTLPLLFTDRDWVAHTLREYDLRLAIENHPERQPTDMLAEVGAGADGRIGTCIDTGWYATQGYDPAQAIFDLRHHLLHIHLKDVLPGEHINCGYGQGIVPIDACLDTLRAIGYSDDISIENHTFDHDPTTELKSALQWVMRRMS